MSKDDNQARIAIVGPCASGKTTLAHALQAKELSARQIAQEHSYVANMWEVLAKPTILIYLDASYPVCTQRKSLSWTLKEYEAQIERLAHARANCHIYIETDELTPDEVLQCSLQALQNLGIGIE
jgi:deoxyadenosine/deoxycytidine kinase